MTYTELFNVSGARSNVAVAELSFNEMRSANEALLGKLNTLDLSIEQSEATAANLDAMVMAGEHLGAPSTESEKILFSLGVMSAFGGKVPVKNITGYSMEDMGGEDTFGYAMESLGSRAASVYAWIREQVMKIYDIIETFFYNLMGGIPSARKKAQKMRERASNASGKAMEEKTFEINKQTANVLADVSGAKPKDISGLSDTVEKLGEVVETLDNKYYTLLSGYAKDLESAIGDFDVEAGEAGLTAINAVFAGKSPTQELLAAASSDTPLTLKGVVTVADTDTRYTNKNAKAVPLCSGKSLFFSTNNTALTGAGVTDVTKAEVYYSVVGEVRDTTATLPKMDSCSVSTLALSDVEKLADSIEKACDQIESVTRGVSKGNIKKDKNKLDKAAKKLDANLEKAKNASDDKLSGDNVTASRLALKMTKQYATMVSKPVPQVIALLTTLINQSLSVGNKSISLHK